MITSGNDIVIISICCKGNMLRIMYPLRVKLCGLCNEDVRFAIDKIESHSEVGNTNYLIMISLLNLL